VDIENLFSCFKKLGQTLGSLFIGLNDTVELSEVFVEIKRKPFHLAFLSGVSRIHSAATSGRATSSLGLKSLMERYFNPNKNPTRLTYSVGQFG
jgi:hypothetical protein